MDSTVGGAAATGDGDIMMRFLPSFAAVQLMRAGADPTTACKQAIAPIATHFPTFSGGLVCLDKDGNHGAATYNMAFSYSVFADGMSEARAITVVE